MQYPVMNKTIIFLFFVLFPLPLYAYIGPGMSGGIIAIVVGFFAAIFLALWGILYYPIKRALKKRKNKKTISKEVKNAPK